MFTTKQAGKRTISIETRCGPTGNTITMKVTGPRLSEPSLLAMINAAIEQLKAEDASTSAPATPLSLDETIHTKLNLSASDKELLKQHGFIFLGDLVTSKEDDLLRLERVGPAMVGRIQATLEKCGRKIGETVSWTRPIQEPQLQ